MNEIHLELPLFIHDAAISCSNVRGVFPFTSVSGFALCKYLQPSLEVSHLFSWHVRATEQLCLYLRRQPPLQIWGLQKRFSS